MDTPLVTMYAFRLNPRESSYVLDRLLESERIHSRDTVTPMDFTEVLTDMLEEHPMFHEMWVRLVSTEAFPDDLTQIPNSFPYMFLFGFPVPNGATLEDIRAVYQQHPMFEDIRLLRRFFRQRLGLHLQFTGEQAGIWVGHTLPTIPFVRPVVDLNLA